MKSTINYSGFVDLLEIPCCEQTHPSETAIMTANEPGREQTDQVTPDQNLVLLEQSQ